MGVPENDIRVASGIRYRPELDGIRGIAVLLVIAGHVRLGGRSDIGWSGVTLFFVLSGYLITSLLLAEHRAQGNIDFRRFYERRIRRLLPALVTAVVATGLLLAFLGRFDMYPKDAALAVLYLGDLRLLFGTNMGFLSHTWSLSLEEQFYVVWPAVFTLTIGHRRAMLAILGVGLMAGLASRILVSDAEQFYLPHTRMDAIVLGCVIALMRFRAPRWSVIAAWAVVGWVVVAQPDQRVGLTAATIAAALIVTGSRPGVLSWRPLVRTGELSYGLYLWHFAPAIILAPLAWSGDPSAQATVFVVAFALALLSERFIEKPFRASRDRAISSANVDNGDLGGRSAGDLAIPLALQVGD
jgi:peptidoglycan/LPS O-acetylase OafA/YrhL